jgi:two-component system response regulator FixJ
MGRIGIVEDEAAIREAFSLLLTMNGYIVEAFDSAAAFLAEAPVDTYDCLVLDMNMPSLSGVELLELLRSRHIHVPAIFVTGRSDPALHARAGRAGASKVIAKPVTEQMLVASIESARSAPSAGGSHDRRH